MPFSPFNAHLSLILGVVWRYFLMFSFFSPSFALASAQEQEFLQKQQQELDGELKIIIQQHKVEIATIERDCLNHKQQLMRGVV